MLERKNKDIEGAPLITVWQHTHVYVFYLPGDVLSERACFLYLRGELVRKRLSFAPCTY